MMGDARGASSCRSFPALLLGVGVTAAADAAPQPVARVTDPIGVRGGVLMVPLEADVPGPGWPVTLELALDDGQTIQGSVAWVHAAPPTAPRRWTDDPRGLAVRRIRPDDDPSSAAADGAPYLLLRLPPDGDGSLRLADQVLRPRWHGGKRGAAGSTTSQLNHAPDYPDADSPFEYWRWVLLCEQQRRAPPSSDAYGPIGSLVAEHYADLWRIGLDRLARVSPQAATACRDLLTAVCLDGRQPFAAWVADPGKVGSLLSTLLDFGRCDAELEAAAMAWAGAQGLLVFRLASVAPDLVVLGVASPTGEPTFVRFRWLASGEAAATTVAEPRTLGRVEVRRRATTAGPPAGQPGVGDLHVLLVEAAGREQRLVVRSGVLVARPPGVFFAPLRPALTLADVQAGWQRPIEPDRATLVHVRKLQGRWELFAECRRPPGRVALPHDLDRADDVHETRGIEALTVLFGPEPAPYVLTVPERGRFRLFRGVHDGTLEVHRRSFTDRWYCRILLPESWLRAAGGVVLVGVWRTHGDSEALETGPYAALPWQTEPGRAVIDLTAWDEVPVERE